MCTRQYTQSQQWPLREDPPQKARVPAHAGRNVHQRPGVSTLDCVSPNIELDALTLVRTVRGSVRQDVVRTLSTYADVRAALGSSMAQPPPKTPSVTSRHLGSRAARGRRGWRRRQPCPALDTAGSVAVTVWPAASGQQ